MYNELTEVNDEPPHTQEPPSNMARQENSQMVADKASRCNLGGNINAIGFLRGVSLRQRAGIRFCGFDDTASHILHDWGINNVVGMAKH
jgi:hypothetical protein